MDNATFRQMMSEILRDFEPSRGDNLLGMEIDSNAYLGGLDVLQDAQARRTGDPARLIAATAVACPNVTAEQVAAALEEVVHETPLWLSGRSCDRPERRLDGA